MQTKWRLILTAIVLAVGVSQLVPLTDRPFDAYLLSQAKANKQQFQDLLGEAQALVAQKKSSHLLSALTSLCHEKSLDLSTFFTQFNTSDIKNADKKNQILLQHLLKNSQSVFKQGLDLKGGVAFSLEVNKQVLEGKSDWERQQLLQKAIEVIVSRIDALGVAEPIVRPRGNSNIEVQLPGISLESNPDIVHALKKPAKLDFRLVNDNVKPGDKIPLGYEQLFVTHENDKGEEIQYPIIVKRIPEMTGKSIKEAHPVVDPYGRYEISLQMTSSGKERFATITRQNLHKRLAIVLDGKVCSAPVIQSEITQGQASISGNFTQREAIELSNVLNNPLEFELDLAEIYEVGPSLASGAKTVAIQASLVSIVLVLILMIFYYRLSGAICGITLFLNFLFIVISWAVLGATITLPSITALALTFGMAVDANVLIFERVREEIRNGHDSVVALELGHQKAFITIFDSNLTTLLTACLLIWLGTGPVKGFGITLAIGILTTLFTVLCFNRAVLELLARKDLFFMKTKAWLGNANYNFMRCRKIAFLLSGTLLIIGIIGTAHRGKSVLGIDFVGGDELLLKYEQEVDCQEVRKFAQEQNFGEVNAVYQKYLGNQMYLLKVQTERDKGISFMKALQKQYPEAKLQTVAHNQMGASVSSEVQKNAIVSVLMALLCILIYVAMRFELSYGVGAVFALLHDTLITIGLYIALGHQFSAPMVAAVLMVIGYSINDTIIIFDRIREEIKANLSLTLLQVINLAINKTLSRTLVTSLTTFIPACTLYVFCSGIVSDYALVFLLGILIGTFSSVFIASPIFYLWNKGDRKHLDKKPVEAITYEWMQ